MSKIISDYYPRKVFLCVGNEILLFSPVYASEFGDESVARLAGYPGSIPNIYQDTNISIMFYRWINDVVNSYHIFCSARIIYLVNIFKLRMTPITTQVWCLMKYVLCMKKFFYFYFLALENVRSLLSQLSLDQLVVCSFYAICRVHGINISFKQLLDIYTYYLQPLQNLNSSPRWMNPQQLWFNLDLSFLGNVCVVTKILSVGWTDEWNDGGLV